MYKVFFNDSTIHIGSEINKSLNNNVSEKFNLACYNAVNQVVSQIESSAIAADFFIPDQEDYSAWSKFRSQFIEIPAAGGLVKNASGSFLFIKRLGVWDLPKGKIEKNETPEVAAIREVGEECGLSGLQITRQLDSTFHIYRSQYLPFPNNLVLKETKWFLMSYSGSEIPVPQVEEDIEEVRWVAVSDLVDVMSNTYRSLHEFLENYISEKAKSGINDVKK